MGYSSWVRKELDTTDHLSMYTSNPKSLLQIITQHCLTPSGPYLVKKQRVKLS